MKKRKFFWMMIRFVAMMLAVLSLMACAYYPFISKTKIATLLSSHKNVEPEVSQVIMVMEDRFLFIHSTKVYVMEKSDLTWRQIMTPMNAVIGRNGFAPVGEKREGDGRTPSGLYRFGTAFGYTESAVTKMPYRQALADDLWIDDPNAPDYNSWAKQGQTQANSYEKMRRDDNLYQYGIVIAYNTHPVIKNHGSAIFIHVWAGAESTTAGCIALSKEDLLKILAWLNPEANPVILINPEPL